MPTEPPDIFFSADGLGESRHVFLAGNDLPGAWQGRERFVIAELGFGTGLNLLALLELAQRERLSGRSVPRLVYQSVELFPQPSAVFLELAERWPELKPFAQELASIKLESGHNHFGLSWGELTVFVGDARLLPALEVSFEPCDAWFLDGYAPSKDAALWEPELLAWVGRTTRGGGSAATYTAAGQVKRALRAAGFDVKRLPGWGNKRHMVRAILRAGGSFWELSR